AFHEFIVHGRSLAVNPQRVGTKAGFYYRCEIAAGEEVVVRLRLAAASADPSRAIGPEFDALFAQRIAEADEFYAARMPAGATEDELRVVRQGYAGLLWSKQFYAYI